MKFPLTNLPSFRLTVEWRHRTSISGLVFSTPSEEALIINGKLPHTGRFFFLTINWEGILKLQYPGLSGVVQTTRQLGVWGESNSWVDRVVPLSNVDSSADECWRKTGQTASMHSAPSRATAFILSLHWLVPLKKGGGLHPSKSFEQLIITLPTTRLLRHLY